jgi:predicted RNA-binding Zn-ribbon protein involved in translation (DUF1610 family)
MAKTEKEKTLAPICTECGGRMSRYTTLPKIEQRPRINVFRCDHCGSTTITSKENKKQ